MKHLNVLQKWGLVAFLYIIFFSISLFSYPVVKIKNNTLYTISGKVKYASLTCRNDKYTIKPGKTWRAKSRGVCLVTGITGKIHGKTKYGESSKITKYSSSGTGYAKFQINTFGDRYRIFSENEYKKSTNTKSGKSPGFRFINETPWPVLISLNQVGCLYYGVVPAKFNGKAGVMRRDTGAVWFTINANIQPDGVSPLDDWDCVQPVAEIVGEVALAALSGGTSTAATAGRIAIKQTSKELLKQAAKKAGKKAVRSLASFGAKELGKFLTDSSKIMMPGQYAGAPWPAQCNKMPEYKITGGPVPLKDDMGKLYLQQGSAFKISKINSCGNSMMPSSPKTMKANTVNLQTLFPSKNNIVTAKPKISVLKNAYNKQYCVAEKLKKPTSMLCKIADDFSFETGKSRGTVLLKNKRINKCLFNNKDGRFGYGKCARKYNDKDWFIIDKRGDGTFRLKNFNSKKCLFIQSNGNIGTAKCKYTDQFFKLE